MLIIFGNDETQQIETPEFDPCPFCASTVMELKEKETEARSKTFYV